MQMPYPIWTLGMLFFLQCNKPLDTEWKVIERYSDGKKKTENKWLDEQKGLVLTKDYYPNGNLAGEFSWRDTVLEGWTKKYYENGQIHFRTYLVNGKMEGGAWTYYPNGKLDTEEAYQNNIRQGFSKSYLESGELSVINYRIDDFCYYIKQYKRDANGKVVSETETYIPQVVLAQDTIEVNKPCKVSFLLQLPEEYFNLDSMWINIAFVDDVPAGETYKVPNSFDSCAMASGGCETRFTALSPGPRAIIGYLYKREGGTKTEYQFFEKKYYAK